MEIASGLAAVERRIAEIAGLCARLPAPDESPFGEVVSKVTPGGRPALVAHEEVERLVRANASAAHVDPALIEAVIANESGFDPKATSSAGARGLMQLMPDTAAELGVTDSYDPAQNVFGGSRYLRDLLDRFGGNTKLALAAYNAGAGAVEKYGGVPPYAQTRAYVQNVLASYEKISARRPR
jgi:soluble lytic murein transglycosylase-like protein